MAVTVQLPTTIRSWCGCPGELSLSATSLRDALSQIGRDYPALHRSVCDETGRPRTHINVFVNSSLATENDLDMPLFAGDTIAIFPAVSGG